jgi:asparagine synthase (glutamine-hydrolysing)
MSDSMRDRLFTEGFRRQLQGYRASEVMRAHAANAPTDDPLSLIQYLDIKTYLPGDILTKVDRASMAHALEVRVPLLDHKLVEWISGLPPSYKLQGGEGKYLFKKALEPHLPREILYRNKMGFATPLARWFRGPLRQRVRSAILGPTLAATGIFNAAYLREMVDQHESGRRDYSAPIWSLLMLEAFLRNVHEGSRTAPASPVLQVA